MLTSKSPEVISFFDNASNTFSYIVKDPNSTVCALIDSVLDFEAASGTTSFESADKLLTYVSQNNLQVEWILETHVHADHLSAAPYLKQKLGAKIGIGSNIKEVQEVFGKAFNAGTDFALDGSQFDKLFDDNETFEIGSLKASTIHTPGHTPACMTYIIGDSAFVGDTLFMPDFGTARTDFPGGSAEQLYQSIWKILQLPNETKLYMCHDYKAPGRDEFAYQTTVKEQRETNIHVKEGVSMEEFVAFRTERDANLSMPKLILPSVQVNMRAGQMPPEEDDGHVYLKIPINRF